MAGKLAARQVVWTPKPQEDYRHTDSYLMDGFGVVFAETEIMRHLKRNRLTNSNAWLKMSL
ncbi:hypothetical protein GCM10028773_26130 [Spirosoma koreense]